MKLLKLIFLALLNINILFGNQLIIDDLSKLSASSLYNLDEEQIKVSINPYIKEKEIIKAVKIIDNTDNSVFFQIYKNENNKIVNKIIPKTISKFDKFTQDIKYNNEIIGTIEVYTKNNSIVNLTAEEELWIKNNIVTIGVEQWSPIVFSNDGNDIDGIAGDITKNIIKHTGLKIKVVNDNWDKLLSKFENKKIDILPATYYTTARAKYGLYSEPYHKMKNAIYFKYTNNIHSIEDMDYKTLAVPKGYGTIDKLQKYYPKIKLVFTKDLDDSINRVLNGKVDALYDGQIAVETQIRSELINGLQSIPVVTDKFKTPTLHYFIKKDELILYSIIQKALKAITYNKKSEIISKWTMTNNKVKLNSDEEKWLSRNIIIKYTFDPDWKPLEMADELKEHKGIISDVIKLIEQKSGIIIKTVYSDTWSNAVDLVKNKDADAFSSGKSKERSKYMNFTDTSLLKIPFVFVSRKGEDYINGFDDLKNKRIAVLKESTIHHLIKENMPDLKILIYESDLDELKDLENNKIDIVLMNSITSKYYINSFNFDNLKIAYKTKFNLDLKFALRKDFDTEALSIINKSLDAISEKEISDIVDKWTIHNVKAKTNWLLLGEIGGSVFSLILFILYNNYKLKTKVEEKTSEIRHLLSAFDTNVIASKTDDKGIITYVSKAFCEISGYEEDELIGKPHNIVRHPDMPKEAFENMWKTIKDNNIWKGEVKNLKKDGGYYWIETIVTPECNSKGQNCGYSAIRQDITAKKEVEDLTSNLELKIAERTKELDEEREFIGSIISSSQDALIVIDTSSHVTTWNISATKIFGFTKDEMIGNNIDVIIPTQFKEMHHKGINRVSNNGDEHLLGRGAIEIEGVHKDGTIIPIDLALNTFNIKGKMYFSANIRDISERKKLIEKIEQDKKDTEQILSNILLPVLITSKEKRKIVYANKYAELQYEKPIEDIVGSDIDNVYIVTNGAEPIIKELVTNGYVENMEQEFKTFTGRTFNALLNVTPITYKDEECYIGMVTDITEQKKMEKKIRDIHKHTRDSIEYASLIQGALIPEQRLFDNHFKDSFVHWMPKDIVGGDIYLFEELRDGNECLLMCIDCTGHGVPGAFVTMLVKAIERQIVAKIEHDKYHDIDISPSWILSYFNKKMKQLLKQDSANSKSNAGFDGGIIYYNRKTQILKFSGAETPLFYFDENGEFNTIKGSRHSVGYKKCDVEFKYKEHIINVKEGMKFYITTDGYIDQNGGAKDFPFGKKRFTKIIKENSGKTMNEQKEVLINEMTKYELMVENNDRNDDITVIGFEIKDEQIETLLEYYGELTQGIITHNVELLENKIDDINMLTKLSTIVIELTQNMMNYSKSYDEDDMDIIPAGYIEVIRDKRDRYYVTSRNIISINDKNKIEPVLNEIENMDIDDIKKKYRELRRSGQNTHEKGGGIGFFEIAKLARDVSHKFKAINKNKYSFEFKINVERRLKERG